MAAAAPPQPPEAEPLGEPAGDSGLGGRLAALLPHGARQWVEAGQAGLRPWGSFLDQRRFGVPRDLGELGRRLGRNGRHFQSNYGAVGLALGLYCLVTSPLLLLALGVFFGVSYGVRLRAQRGPLLLLGRELSPVQQQFLAGGAALPLLWLGGGGAALFWVLGATLVLIGAHAALRVPDPPESDGPPALQMESV
ncbi:LOW QUALITY PROTEIN: prenylated Rab acceptor protein 1 [Phaenicophaeus curvirostris]|uniref:LOW QUALITY PROTEIN: prenylated Rab acceptor protein 1 n=1 Tax=Phaenicophaeus curvirostris TaxID=33595 RepID=UPI0037F0E0F0